MKTAKLIAGIISIVIFGIIVFQSCAVGLGNAMEGNTADTSGAGGMFLAFLVLIGGIVGITTKESKGGSITAGIFYLVAALLGFTNKGTFGDLVVWSTLSLIFGALFLLGGIMMKREVRQE